MDLRNQQSNSSELARAAETKRRLAPQVNKPKKRSKKLWAVIVIIIVVIIIAGGAYFLFGRHHGAEAKINNNEYQAVFLTNGQVYFGKLSNVNNSYLDLKDIFYLQVPQSVQGTQDAAKKDQQTQLVKLGNELHGPEDDMQVSNKQVLFWENLKNDGKVAKAIQQFQKK